MLYLHLGRAPFMYGTRGHDLTSTYVTLRFDTSDQRNARTHALHIALPISLMNVVIGNGGSIFLCTPSWRVYNFDVHSPFLIITCLVNLQALMLKLYILLNCWEVWYLKYVTHPLCFSNPIV